jgi:hypothetical protein
MAGDSNALDILESATVLFVILGDSNALPKTRYKAESRHKNYSSKFADVNELTFPPDVFTFGGFSVAVIYNPRIK